MRLPNGFGSVVKLKGKRRNPYFVRKTTGWNDKGHPVYMPLGYFPTREDGMIALATFNNEPWNLEQGKITLEELYKLWYEKRLHKLGKSNQGSLKSAYNHCVHLNEMKYRDIRTHHMQDAIDNCGRGYGTQSAIKCLFGHLDNFAFELDITSKRYSERTSSEPIPETTKTPFTDDEVNRLWEIQDEPWVDSVLIFIYSGWRIAELLGLKCADVDIEAGIMRGGVKTRSGKGRIVPIHSRIASIVQKRVAGGEKYLFMHKGKSVTPTVYYNLWDDVMSKIEADHTPHDCRHTFRSRLDSANANKVCIDLIMGHKSKDVGERVYTHKTIQELKDTIELIKD